MAEIRTKESITSVKGRMTVVEARELKQAFMALLEEKGDISLDLSEVEDMDSAGFQLLALLSREARYSGNRKVIVTEHSQATREIIKLYGSYEPGQ